MKKREARFIRARSLYDFQINERRTACLRRPPQRAVSKGAVRPRALRDALRAPQEPRGATWLEPFLPKPEPTREGSRCRSVEERLRRRLSAQPPMGTITCSWNMRKRFCLLNCRQRSQASRKRFGHLPG